MLLSGATTPNGEGGMIGSEGRGCLSGPHVSTVVVGSTDVREVPSHGLSADRNGSENGADLYGRPHPG